jgi:signal transduction histidine kinase
VDPRVVRPNAVPPPVLIERVIVDGRTGGAPGAAGAAAPFPPGSGKVEIHYRSLSFVQPKRARHRYRLAGFDRDWVDAGARRVAYYTNVPPGRYRFEVQAANADGVWNEAGAAWALAIAPHFYQTWWFYGACACALGGLAWLAHRARLGRLRAVYLAAFAERNRVARELHDTLLQGMNAVAMQLAAVRMRLPADAEEARRALEGVQGLVTETLQDTRQAVWDLREQPSGDGDLGVALGRLCRRLCTPLSVRHDVRVEGEPFTLPHPVQDEVFRIAQEAVQNALKHAAPRSIDVHLRWGAEALALAVRDDGRGFEPDGAAAAPAPGHYGLLGLRERAAKIGGKLEIASGPGRGTAVELVVARRREPEPTPNHA